MPGFILFAVNKDESDVVAALEYLGVTEKENNFNIVC